MYTATKHAVVAFSESVNYETEPRTVHVTAVNPGFVATEGFPADGVPRRRDARRQRVAETIVKVIRDGDRARVLRATLGSPSRRSGCSRHPCTVGGCARLARSASRRRRRIDDGGVGAIQAATAPAEVRRPVGDESVEPRCRGS